MPPQQKPKSGDDVTALMSGADVTSLMSGAQDQQQASNGAVPRDSSKWSDLISHAAMGLGGPLALLATPEGRQRALQAWQMVKENPAGTGAIIGGVAGSLASGGLGVIPAMLMAGGGGYAGATVGQAVNRIAGGPTGTPEEESKDALTQGLVQMGAEGVGRMAAGAATKAGTWLMDRAINPTAKLAEEFPDMSEAAIQHAITVNKGGIQQARASLFAAKQVANETLKQTAAKGVKVPLSAATDGLNDVLELAINGADPVGDLKRLAIIEKNMTSGRGAALDPVAADELKASLQLKAKQAYAAAKMGKPAQSLDANAYAAMAKSLNQSIGDVTEQAGFPGYKAANAEAQDMIGVLRGVTRADSPGANLFRAVVRPGAGAVVGSVLGAEEGGTKGAAIGGILGAAMGTPANMSRLALMLRSGAVRAALRRSPGLLSTLLSQSATEPTPAVDWTNPMANLMTGANRGGGQ